MQRVGEKATWSWAPFCRVTCACVHLLNENLSLSYDFFFSQWCCTEGAGLQRGGRDERGEWRHCVARGDRRPQAVLMLRGVSVDGAGDWPTLLLYEHGMGRAAQRPVGGEKGKKKKKKKGHTQHAAIGNTDDTVILINRCRISRGVLIVEIWDVRPRDAKGHAGSE
ncbi:hypothetical protein K504DRAFT_172920 [Pleomassaria siparia CBS 279.74]|uniref:Uncharacterized protein n=1 Tax=Pleomassaria siparia CBS 279.74 TaxID=1314801 RepID=A0A6G1JTI0_9PLEO|nr:hypothetical protein K504DRAFT_172920 [Pleomassaria siparia CBS 279.74]